MNKEEKPLPSIDFTGLQKQFSRAMAGLKALSKAFKIEEDPARSKHAGSKNHNKKRNKVRAKMAKKSNQINRIRVKGWKH